MPSACQRGYAGDFGLGLKGLGPGGSILIGGNVVAAVGPRAACLLLVDLGASFGVKLGGRTIAKRSIACRRYPSLRLARGDAVLPSSAMLISLFGPLRGGQGVRKRIVQRTVSAARGNCDQRARKPVSIDPYGKIIIERGFNVHSRP